MKKQDQCTITAILALTFAVAGCTAIVHVEDNPKYLHVGKINNAVEISRSNVNYKILSERADPLFIDKKRRIGAGMALEIPIKSMLERVVQKYSSETQPYGSSEFTAVFKPSAVEYRLLTDVGIEKAEMQISITLDLLDKEGDRIFFRTYSSGRVQGDWFSMFRLGTYGCHGCGPVYDEEYSKVAFLALEKVVSSAIKDIAEHIAPNQAPQPTSALTRRLGWA